MGVPPSGQDGGQACLPLGGRACEALGLTRNLLVWSRGVWPSCPTTRNEAVDKRGMQSLISSVYLLHYLGKQKEIVIVLDTLVCRCLSFRFSSVYSTL